METADTLHVASDGAFDVTLGPLIDAWGFGANLRTPKSPNPAELEQALALVGQDQLLLTPTGLIKTDAKAEVFTSGIGKGYGVDLVAQALTNLGLTDFMVEIGGDLYTSGRNRDAMEWKIGIESPNPLDSNLQQIANVSNLGMATSGDYRNYFEEDGVRYSHILDATTGRPITHRTASATVLAESAMLADGWATAMLALGRERGMEIANTLDVAVLFIDRNGASLADGFEATPSQRFLELQA
jgi:thiamine biosynthesis lipoprotein